MDLRSDDASLDAASGDFGGVVRARPAAVLVPRSVEDVAAGVGWADERRMPFAARGCGHSVWGGPLAPGGLVVAMRSLRAIGPVEGDRVAVEAGATWSEVLTATLPHGLTPPVLPGYLELSVGGTLAVGGIGATTLGRGAVDDHVLAREVVAGVTTRATLALVPAPACVRVRELQFDDLGAMLADARRLAADPRNDELQGAIAPLPEGGFAYRIGAAEHLPEPEPGAIGYFDHLGRLAALEAALRANGQWWLPHPWLTSFAGDAHVERLVADELDRLDPDVDLGPFGQVLLSPIRRQAVSTPLVRLPPDDLCFAFNLIRLPDTAATADRLVAANAAAAARIRAAGGIIYRPSALSSFPQPALS